MSKHTTYILCGGRSSRMHTDKALSIYKGQTFLSFITNAVRHLNDRVVLVSSNIKHNKLNVECIPDIIDSKGPVAGIVTALKNTLSNDNIILSCDIPLITADLINFLIRSHTVTYDATIICVNKKIMPLIGIYNTSSLPIFEKHLLNNQLKLTNVLKDLNINYTEAPKHLAYQTSNINTPEQLKNIH
ncbi:molybdenum cofactor guanylyltransferase [Aquimarina agarivorans]|uniref:molybdenum cofactor guanylyltransferase n=1 Tax=Aquimarina agarivorans TaxID=980584 RepID=UPI000248E6D5|nr:molybdenum cofactor guanylyltransferase [Aquimarina agarivorans]